MEEMPTDPSPREERGTTAAEYALLISLIAGVILTGAAALGASVNDMYDRSCDSVATVTGGTSC